MTTANRERIFVTICSHARRPSFGRIVGRAVHVSEVGLVIGAGWQEIPRHFPQVVLDAFVVMPDHVHGILVIQEGEIATGPRSRRFGEPVPGGLPTIVGSFKAAATRRVNELHGSPGAPLWQRNYFERVLRNEHELRRARWHIVTNPLRTTGSTSTPP